MNKLEKIMLRKLYCHVFSTQFNLNYNPPLKDTCQFFYSFQNKLFWEREEERKIIEQEKELHFRKGEKAKESLKDDMGKPSDDYYVLTYDLQKALDFSNYQLLWLTTKENFTSITWVYTRFTITKLTCM